MPKRPTHRRPVALTMLALVLGGAALVFVLVLAPLWGGDRDSSEPGDAGAAPSHLLPIHDDRMRWGFIDARGTLRIPTRYSRVAPFRQGRARVQDDAGHVFFIDEEGTVRSLNYREALDFSDGLAAVKTREGQWGYIDQHGQAIIPPRFADAESFSGGRAVVWVQAHGEVKAGLIDPLGSFIVDPQFDELTSTPNGSARAATGGLWGVIDRRGQFVVSHRFAAARAFAGGFAAVSFREHHRHETTWNFIRPDGSELLPAGEYTALSDFSGGLAVADCVDGGKTVLDNTGARLTGCDVDRVCLLSNGVALAFRGEADARHHDCVWPERAEVEVLSAEPLPPEFDTVVTKATREGFTLTTLRGRLKGPLLGTSFAEVRPFVEGLAIVRDKRGYSAVIDDRARFRVPFRAEELTQASEQMVTYVDTSRPCDPRYGTLTSTGKLAIEAQYPFLGAMSEGMLPACQALGEARRGLGGACEAVELRCGYVGPRGQARFWLEYAAFSPLRVPGESTDLRPFENGLAPARGEDGRFGYVDPSGRWELEPKYEEAAAFGPEGVAPVRSVRHGVTLNHDGNIVEARPQAALERLEPVLSSSEGDTPPRYGYATADGKLVIPHSFTRANPFAQGRAAVAVQSGGTTRWGIIDTQGKEILPFELEAVSMTYSEGTLVATKAGKAGLLDLEGQWLLPPRYDIVHPMQGGHAIVVQAGRLGLVNRAGQLVLAPEFHQIAGPSEGLVAVLTDVEGEVPSERVKRWGYVDLQGRFAVPATLPAGHGLRVPGPFTDGVACIALERNTEAYIDRTGRVLGQAQPPLCELPAR